VAPKNPQLSGLVCSLRVACYSLYVVTNQKIIKIIKIIARGAPSDISAPLFKYFKDEYYADYFELDPTWISRDFMEYKNMNDALKENDMSDFKEVIHANGGSVIVQNLLVC
jgi:hypothetical protein